MNGKIIQYQCLAIIPASVNVDFKIFPTPRETQAKESSVS